MPAPTPAVDHLGVEHRSHLARSLAWGQLDTVVRQRLAAGWLLSDALTAPPIRDTSRRPVTVRGVAYRSIRAACAALGVVSRPLVTQRIALGHPPDVAIEAALAAQEVRGRWARIAAVLDAWRARYYGRGAA